LAFQALCQAQKEKPAIPWTKIQQHDLALIEEHNLIFAIKECAAENPSFGPCL
jgi:hypothetical protein